MFDWFPNWRGELCVIVAAGPSAKSIDLNSCRGLCRVIVINNSWQLAPWADVLYAADGKWWNKYYHSLNFGGLRVTVDKSAAKSFGLRLVELTPGSYQLSTEKGRLGIGGNSGFHALNFATQCEVSKIALVGFDMTVEHGTHWHGDHVQGLANPREFNMQRWRRVMDEAYPRLCELGVEVVNVSETSALTAFPKVDWNEIMKGVGHG